MLSGMPSPTPRAVNRAEHTRAILESATRQLAEVGPAALSLRAVARDLDMASSAVYRYVESRDALLTHLLLRSYDALGAAVEDADRAPADRSDLAGRFATIAHVVRDWARARPHEYALLYGSPVPGYVAPQDTVPSAMRVSEAVLRLVSEAQQAGLRPPTTAAPDAAEIAAIDPVLQMTDPPLDPAMGLRALLVWATLFGHLSQELFGHLHLGVLDYDAHFDRVVAQLAADLGLTA